MNGKGRGPPQRAHRPPVAARDAETEREIIMDTKKMMKAVLFRDGSVDTVEFNGTFNGADGARAVMFGADDDHTLDIQERTIAGKWFDLVVDDEGLINDEVAFISGVYRDADEVKFRNLEPLQLINVTHEGKKQRREIIAGPILVCSHDENGNLVGLSEREISLVKSQVLPSSALVKGLQGKVLRWEHPYGGSVAIRGGDAVLVYGYKTNAEAEESIRELFGNNVINV